MFDFIMENFLFPLSIEIVFIFLNDYIKNLLCLTPPTRADYSYTF